MIGFFAPGVARPKGSKRLVRTRGGRTLLLEDSVREKPWRQVVTLMAMDAMKGAPPMEGPIVLRLAFTFPRPKAHYTTKGLRSNAPTHHIGKPDASKLARSVEDALNGVAFKDDSAIALLVVTKRYTETTPGVRVEIERLQVEAQAGLFFGAPIATSSLSSDPIPDYQERVERACRSK